MTEDKAGYKTIFKSTFLFGFVQVFNIITKVGINKAVAILLGAEGMGIIGLFQSTINILKTGFDLGISYSAVRDISMSKEKSDDKYALILCTVKRIILLTSLLGATITFFLASSLSKWTFGNENYKYPFMWISIVVFLNVITEGQLAILKGARMLKSLAKASLYGSVVGLLTSVPLYYLFEEKGIVPSLIVSAFSAFCFSFYFVSKIKADKDTKIKTIEALKGGSVMIKMGIALMYVTFLGYISDYLIRSYINQVSDLEMVGLFQAGTMITNAYFGVVVVALATDYYPRISSINDQNEKIADEFNRQVEVSLLLIGPLIIFFLFMMPFFVAFLYSKSFFPVIDYLEFAVFGILMTLCSNPLGLILLAKRATKIFFFTATIGRVVFLVVNILFYNYWGLKGLGIGTIITGCFHLFLMQSVIWKLYKIKMDTKVIQSFFLMIVLTIIAFFLKNVETNYIKYTLGIILLIISLLFTIHTMKKNMNIDIIQIIKQKIKK